MNYPGYNSFWAPSEEVIGLLQKQAPQTIEQLFALFGERRRWNVWLDFRTRVPLTNEHIERVLDEHLSEYVGETEAGWRLTADRPPMPPIWNVFEYPWGSMGYRMGGGETYWHNWCEWYGALDDEAQRLYREKNPEPASWCTFYEMMHLPRGNQKARQEWRERRDETHKKYLASEYQRAETCEDEGRLVEALFHFTQVARRGGGNEYPDAIERSERLREQLGD